MRHSYAELYHIGLWLKVEASPGRALESGLDAGGPPVYPDGSADASRTRRSIRTCGATKLPVTVQFACLPAATARGATLRIYRQNQPAVAVGRDFSRLPVTQSAGEGTALRHVLRTERTGRYSRPMFRSWGTGAELRLHPPAFKSLRQP